MAIDILANTGLKHFFTFSSNLNNLLVEIETALYFHQTLLNDSYQQFPESVTDSITL